MALEQRRPSLLSRFARWAIVGIYKRAGWTAIGSVPEPRRFVLVAAPHTSNWDFLYFMGLTEELGIMPYFMAKKPLFRWPWKNFLLDSGALPGLVTVYVSVALSPTFNWGPVGVSASFPLTWATTLSGVSSPK